MLPSKGFCSDPLAALTVLKSRCRVCGEHVWGHIAEEIPDGDLVAICPECGHQWPVANTITWN